MAAANGGYSATTSATVAPGSLSGKVAVINGGTRGLGAEIATQLAEQGVKVVITGRTKVQGEQTAADIAAKGGEVMFVAMDATKEAEIEALHKKIVDDPKFGGFDFAVNNLGVEDTPPGPLENSTEAIFDHCMNTKAKSAFLGMKHQIRHFKGADKPGAIVNVSSMIGLGGHAVVPAYSAANGAVQALTKSVAIEVAKEKIRINCVCPSAMEDTPMLHRFTGGSDGSKEGDGKAKAGEGYAGYMDHFPAKYPMGRIAKKEEVAKATIFLLSDASSFITGHCLPVEGGMVINLM
jgi:NAD(P)-dependent dehydrogenase (short-subunit alcohol dehydrogenase family)